MQYCLIFLLIVVGLVLITRALDSAISRAWACHSCINTNQPKGDYIHWLLWRPEKKYQINLGVLIIFFATILLLGDLDFVFPPKNILKQTCFDLPCCKKSSNTFFQFTKFVFLASCLGFLIAQGEFKL